MKRYLFWCVGDILLLGPVPRPLGVSTCPGHAVLPNSLYIRHQSEWSSCLPLAKVIYLNIYTTLIKTIFYTSIEDSIKLKRDINSYYDCLLLLIQVPINILRQVFYPEEKAVQSVRCKSKYVRTADDEQSPPVPAESLPRGSLHRGPWSSGVRPPLSGGWSHGYLEHHDTLPGESLGGVQGDHGQGGSHQNVHGQEDCHPAVADGPYGFPTSTVWLQQVQ